jgi:hypothetical protein
VVDHGQPPQSTLDQEFVDGVRRRRRRHRSIPESRPRQRGATPQVTSLDGVRQVGAHQSADQRAALGQQHHVDVVVGEGGACFVDGGLGIEDLRMAEHDVAHRRARHGESLLVIDAFGQ